MGCRAQKTTVKINHTEESLKCRFVHGRRKILDGGGVLGQRMQAGTGESVSKELSLRQGKLALAQANRQAMGAEMLNMRSLSQG